MKITKYKKEVSGQKEKGTVGIRTQNFLPVVKQVSALPIELQSFHNRDCNFCENIKNKESLLVADPRLCNYFS